MKQSKSVKPKRQRFSKPVPIIESDLGKLWLGDVDSYFGVARPNPTDSSDVGFIQQRGYREGLFRVVCSQRIGIGNGWSQTEHETIAGVIREALSAGFQVYRFENPESLFRWLSTFKTFDP